MKLFIHSSDMRYSCKTCMLHGHLGDCDASYFISSINDVHSIDVPDYITINTLAHIIKDKENMTVHNFENMILQCDRTPIFPGWVRDHAWQMSASDQQLQNYRYLTNGKLNEIPYINDDSHINIVFRCRG